MILPYFTAGGLRIDYLITADQQVHLQEMGGNAIYSAVGARTWTPEVGILSRVGENYPQQWLEQLQRARMRTDGVVRVPGQHDMRTFYAYPDLETRVDTDPQQHFARLGLSPPAELADYVDSTPGQDEEDWTPLAIRPGDVPASYRAARAALLCPQGWASHRALSAALCEQGVIVLLDLGERYIKSVPLEQVLCMLRYVHTLLPSEQELETLLGPADPLWAAQRLTEAGPALIVIKMGSRGSFLYSRTGGRGWRIPAYPVQVVDVTGAGDAYCGGFMVGYEETRDPILAACYGAISASFVLEGFGALYALRHTRAEAEARLAHLRKAVEQW
ncbi:MAG: carbohydrate kinase family protein [Chloroflexi bacterium]|nr:carbohydrate kinase family protein [Chloroflexota bacterium]